MCDLRTTMNEMEQRYSFNADTLPERLVRQTLFRANRLLMEAYTEILELEFDAWQFPTLAWGDPTLPSALRRFTSEFGMGSGGTTALHPGMGFFLSPAPETSLHVLSNLQKLKSALGLPLLVSVSRKSFLGATVGLPVKDLGPASLAAELHAIGNGADYVRTHAPGDLRSAITFSETLAKFRSRDARDRGLDHA